MMEETIEKYDALKVENLKRFLETRAIKGHPRYYEIYVDTLKVVERTNKVEEFDSHEEYLYDGTKEVKILLYTTHPTSPRVISRHIFKLQPEKSETKHEPLEGIDLESRISEKIKEQVSVEKERWDSEQVKKELAATKQKLKDAEDYIETLSNQLIEKNKGDGLGELTTTLVKDVLPQFLGNKDKNGNTTLAGAEQKTDGEASFKKQGESKETLSEDEKRHLGFLRQMEDRFEEDQLEAVMQIITRLGEDTQLITTVGDLLNIKSETKN